MSVRQYDLVYILPPDTTEQQATEMHDQIAAIVSRMNGTIEKTENWGRRKLAYEIGPHKEGVYVLEVINGGGDLVKEIDRRLKVIDTIVRHMVVRVDEEKKVVDRTRTAPPDLVGAPPRAARPAAGPPAGRGPFDGIRRRRRRSF